MAIMELLRATAAHLSEGTLRVYAKEFGDFLRWAYPKLSVSDALDRLTKLDYGEAYKLANGYRLYLRAKHFATATINRKLASVRAGYTALLQSGAISYDLKLRPERNRTKGTERVAKRLPANTLDGLKEVVAKVSQPKGKDAEALRLALLGALLGQTGLRRMEVQMLNWGDLRGGVLWVRGKGNKQRSAPVSGYIQKLWNEYREAVKAKGFGTKDADPVFVKLRGKGGRLSLRMLNKLTDKLLQSVGAKAKGISCHSLRHAFATIAANIAPLTDLSTVLGHANLSTTGIYAHTLKVSNISELIAQTVGQNR